MSALIVVGCVILAYGVLRAAWIHGRGRGWREAGAHYKPMLDNQREAVDFHRRAWLALSEKKEKRTGNRKRRAKAGK